jgi:glycine betaine/proline transport system ATP-binding protein
MRLQSVLRKSIVFITHDFDEAIRLADRIAIMKDGAIEQVGTPEEIVLAPATSYVREFTRAVPKAKAVRVRSIFTPGPAPQEGAAVAARATVAEIAPLFLEGTPSLRVTDEAGSTIGTLHREAVIRLMLGG